MGAVVWVVAATLCIGMVAAGTYKVLRPKEVLAQNPRMGWVEDFGQGAVRGIAVAEIAGGLGLVLPVGLDVLPWLTPLAALGVAALMLGAARVHARRGERPMIVVNLVVLALALFVAVGWWVTA